MLEPRIVWISVAAILGGALGARLITAWEHLEYYAHLDGVPLTWAIEHSGKSLIGALAGGYVATIAAKRASRLHAVDRRCRSSWPSRSRPSSAGSDASCRSCRSARRRTLPWGISVSPEAAAAFARCPGCELPMHPSMLYEIAFNLVAIVVILRFRDRVPIVGDALKLYLLAAGDLPVPGRVRPGNEPQALGLTGPQWVLIPLTALLALHFVRRVRARRLSVPAPPPGLRAKVARDDDRLLPPEPTGPPMPRRSGRTIGSCA